VKVAIIGGGFVGLTLGHRLAKLGHKVVIFEKEKYLGGLAISFKKRGWRWYLESYYHHIFTNDYEFRRLARELSQRIIFKKAKTSVLYKDSIYQLDGFKILMSFKPFVKYPV